MWIRPFLTLYNNNYNEELKEREQYRDNNNNCPVSLTYSLKGTSWEKEKKMVVEK